MATAQPQVIGSWEERGPGLVTADFPRKAILLDFHVKPLDFIMLTIPIKNNRWVKQSKRTAMAVRTPLCTTWAPLLVKSSLCPMSGLFQDPKIKSGMLSRPSQPGAPGLRPFCIISRFLKFGAGRISKAC